MRTKYNDDTSEYCHAYSKLPETYYFKTRGERTCPHGIKHEQENFILNYNIEKASLTYVCLSDDCPNKHTFICHINDDKISYEQVDNFCSKLGVKNDLEAAHRVFDLYPHWKYCDNELYVFDDSTGMWSTDEVIFMKIISKFTASLFVLNYNHKYKAGF